MLFAMLHGAERISKKIIHYNPSSAGNIGLRIIPVSLVIGTN